MILPAPRLISALLPSDTSVWSLPWSREPAIVLPLIAFAIAYSVGALRRGGLRLLRWRHSSFATGWTTLFLALTSPIHELGEQLFSAHMLQHEILISAPLSSASQPGPTQLWAFAPRHRNGIGKWVQRVENSQVVRMITGPLNAWILEAAALWLWHIPFLYQATLESDWVHAAQHFSFLGTAVLFWSALYGVGRSAMRYGAATFYVFGAAVHCSALGALLSFSRVLWYPAYAYTTGKWGLTPIEDQQLGGAIMWVPSGVVFMVIALFLMALWISESDRRLRLGSLAALQSKIEQQ